MAWALSDIRSKFRGLSGRPSTNQITDDNADVYINDAYRFRLPKLIGVAAFQTDLTQDTSVDDSGEYSLSDDVITVEKPVTLNGAKIDLYTDKERFFDLYPENEHYITPPTLAIGTTSTAAVANSAFDYIVAGWSYSKAAAETALSGDTVPQNKYGAWSLSIDSDGTITINEASDNATGYDTPALAVNDLPDIGSDEAVMGYVTAISTDSGGFVPGTTALDDSAVTDTYTDGRSNLRGEPEAILVAGTKMFARPKPDDIYRIESQMTLQRPTALSSDTDEPLDTEWGLLIAAIAAYQCMAAEGGDKAKMEDAKEIIVSEIKEIKKKKYLQYSRANRVSKPSF